MDVPAAINLGTGLLGAGVVGASLVPRWAIADTTPHRGRRRFIAGADELADTTLTVLTWAVSKERASYLRRRRQVEIAKLGGGLIVLSGVATILRTPGVRDYGVLVTAVGVVVLLAMSMPYLSARSAFRARAHATAAARVDLAIENLSTDDKTLPLPRLYELNRRQLDQYQELTRKQETTAFRLTQIASVAAFCLLAAGIVAAMVADRSIDKVVAGGLAGVGSTLSAFLASTFFKAHRSANRQLNSYYLEPQRTGRLLAAERLALSDPSIPPEVMAAMVTALMSWEMPGRRSKVGAGHPASTAPTAPTTATAAASLAPAAPDVPAATDDAPSSNGMTRFTVTATEPTPADVAATPPAGSPAARR